MSEPVTADLTAARAVLLAHMGRGMDRNALFGHEGLQDAWDDGDQALRDQLQHALETVFLHGRPDEAGLAVGFWSAKTPRPAFCKELVRRFLAAPTPYLAKLIGGNPRVVLDADDAATLLRLCEAGSPYTNALLGNVLVHAQRDAAWRLLVAKTHAATTLGELVELYDAALSLGRSQAGAWVAELKPVAAALLDALDPSLLSEHQQQLRDLRAS